MFAPHYVAPLERRAERSVALRVERGPDAETIGTLAAGARFDLLDLVGEDAWGVAVDEGLVGYVNASALAVPAA